MNIYFDNAATTPLDAEVLECITTNLKDVYGNPSSIHAFGRKARVLIEQSRKKIASFLNVSPSEIFFTSGGTEAINTVIKSCLLDNGIKTVITSAIEHHAVLYSIDYYSKMTNAKVLFVDINADGEVNQAHLEELLRENNHSLVCLMHANNEIGTLLPVKNIADLTQKYNALFLCDTVQSMAKFNNNLQLMNVDFAVCSAHKFHGPKGIGFLYSRRPDIIKPLLWGGGQERNQRAGTENVAYIAGLSKAFEVAFNNLSQNQQYITDLRTYFVQQIQLNFNDACLNSSLEKGLYTVVNVSFPKNTKTEMLLYQLDIEGIAVSGGSACASGTNHASHVLTALGKSENEIALRFSFSKYNTKEEINYCINLMKKILND